MKSRQQEGLMGNERRTRQEAVCWPASAAGSQMLGLGGHLKTGHFGWRET